MSLLISCLVFLFSISHSSQCEAQEKSREIQRPTQTAAPNSNPDVQSKSPPEGYQPMDTERFKSVKLPQPFGSKVRVGCTFKNGNFAAPEDPNYGACLNESAGKDLFNPPKHSNPSNCSQKRVGSETLFETCR